MVDVAALQRENAELRAVIEQLTKQLAQLNERVAELLAAAQRKHRRTPPPPSPSPPPPSLDGGQLGHVFADDKHYVAKPLQLISTRDGDELSMRRAYHHLLEARELLMKKHNASFARAFDELAERARLPGRRKGSGLWQVIDLGDELTADALRKAAFRRGLRLAKGLPGHIVVAPPICVSENEMSIGLSRLEHAARELA